MTAPSRIERASVPRSAFLHLGPGIVYVVYIFFSGTAHSEGLPAQVSDKLAHFVAFGLMVPLSILAARYFRPRLGMGPGIAMGVLVASGLGALLEFWQSFLPYRDADVLDWVADTAGAIFFAVVVAAAWLVAGRVLKRSV